MTPDAALVSRARDGDLTSMDALVNRHHAAVFRLCLSILGDSDRAEDAVQETFIKALRALSGFRGDASFRTWLMTIARNEAMAEVRRGRRRRQQPLDEAPQLESGEPDAAERVERSDRARRIRARVQELPEKQRLAVTLRIDEGLSFREIGEIIDSSEGAARVNYHHGIRKLREMVNS